jgi:glycosyltransferase involved in cell wall biosynthesis
MKLSVVIACFNGAKTLADVFEGLMRQDWDGEWEVVFVNNGSTDESEQIARSYQGKVPALRIVQAWRPGEPHLGVGHTYAVGMRAAAGDAVLLHDSDDVVGDGWLKAMAAALATHDVVAARMDMNRLNKPWLLPKQPVQVSELVLSGEEPRIPFAFGCTLGIRRSAIEKIGLPDTSCQWAVDMDYGFRIHNAGYQVFLVPDAVLHYRLRSGLRARFKQGRGYGDAQILVQKKYVRSRVPAGQLAAELLPLASKWLVTMLIKFPLSLFSRRKRALWFWDAGWKFGRVSGMVKYLRGN